MIDHHIWNSNGENNTAAPTISYPVDGPLDPADANEAAAVRTNQLDEWRCLRACLIKGLGGFHGIYSKWEAEVFNKPGAAQDPFTSGIFYKKKC